MNEDFFKNLSLDFYGEMNEKINKRDIDGLIHASSIGGCNKKLWYKLTHTEPKKRIKSSLYETFQHGHAVHDWRQSMYLKQIKKLSDWDLICEVSTSDKQLGGRIDPLVIGSTDGLLIHKPTGNRFIYELKTMAEASWEKLRSPQKKHLLQTNIYAKAFDAVGIHIEYFNKNKDKSKYFYVEPTEELFNEAYSQVDYVFQFLNNGEEPLPDPSFFECKSCPYYYICRPEEG